MYKVPNNLILMWYWGLMQVSAGLIFKNLPPFLNGIVKHDRSPKALYKESCPFSATTDVDSSNSWTNLEE